MADHLRSFREDYGADREKDDQTYYCPAIVFRHTDSRFSRPVKRNCLVVIRITKLDYDVLYDPTEVHLAQSVNRAQLYIFELVDDRRRLPEIAPPIESEVP